MISGEPLILMVLANDAQDSLRLEIEEKKVRAILAPAHDAERIEFRSLGNTTFEDIYQEVNRSHRKLAIFHYSGHSNGKGLELEDTLAKKESLATLLGKIPTLKLVFLNGCANQEQVNLLLKNGIGTIIATSAAVSDAKATVFAQMFYQSMAGGQSIQSAFDTAASFLKNDYEDLDIASAAIASQDRGIVLEGDEFPWRLYYREGADVNWRLPLPEQLAETLKKGVTDIGSVDFQLEETLPKKTTTIGLTENRTNAVELETNDRRVQNFNGIMRIQDGSVLFGRHPDCQVVILDRGVSRRHARIYREGEQIILSDEASTNGTFWNDQRISRMPIAENGTLRLDEVEFRVRVVK